MDQLHQYIKAARQYGHSDEQIRDNLVAAGWHHTHIDTAFGDNEPIPIQKPSLPKKQIKKVAAGLIGVAIVALAAISGGIIYWHHHEHTEERAQPSITFYYDDGKTVLWQNSNPAQGYSEGLPSKAPYFVFLTIESLEQKYGIDYWKQGAWQVTTSLNVTLQASAEKAVADNYSNVQS
ncbi:MAG: hypothetical protein ACREBW_06080, partial [Candidatus Micrarchaeaceae archaeon]